MLIRRLKLAGLLSFGPKGIDLPLEPLNVLIGPNGSGKSNLLEAVALLRAAPRGISGPISRAGGLREWIWKGPGSGESITMEVSIRYRRQCLLRHRLVLADRDGRPTVIDEQIEPSKQHNDQRETWSFYRPPRDDEASKVISNSWMTADRLDSEGLRGSSGWSTTRIIARHRPGAIDFAADYYPRRSLLSFAATPEYPGLWHLSEQYQSIRLYRNWSFGPSSKFRGNQSAHGRADFLEDGGSNLALVLSHFHGESKRRFLIALQKLFDGISDIACPVVGGMVTLHLEEDDNRTIPATRLSDGTLRYMCLLAILLHPKPPPLIAIEEPELGLHPDLLPTVCDLLIDASSRSQLIVTTHSDVLVDALTDSPECVVTCEKRDGQTQMRRLSRDALAGWLKDYRLGELWTSGELGGTRW